MRRLRPILPVFALAAALATSAPAQARVPVITLDRGAREFGENFSALTQLFELRDRRLLVIDNQEKEIRLVDFTRGTMSVLGRTGGGPLEYRMPGMLLAGASDTAVYYDVMQSRLLLISPSGALVRTVPFGTTGDVQGMISRMQPMAVDAAGRIYGQTMGMKMPTAPGKGEGPMPTFTDTVEIQSLDFRSGKTTTRAPVRSATAQLAPKVEMTGGNIKLTITAPDFSPVDVWTALPDGRVAILKDGIYRVHFVTAARTETLGPLIPSTPIPVTALEKKALVDSVRRMMDSSMAQMRKTLAGATGNGKTAPPGITADVLEPRSWRATKSPYTALQSSPDGRLWVTVSQPTGTRTSRYDVLNASGALVAQVVLAPGERLVGLGRGTVYTVRKDADDLQYLRRYDLPKVP